MSASQVAHRSRSAPCIVRASSGYAPSQIARRSRSAACRSRPSSLIVGTKSPADARRSPPWSSRSLFRRRSSRRRASAGPETGRTRRRSRSRRSPASFETTAARPPSTAPIPRTRSQGSPAHRPSQNDSQRRAVASTDRQQNAKGHRRRPARLAAERAKHQRRLPHAAREETSVGHHHDQDEIGDDDPAVPPGDRANGDRAGTSSA